MPYDIFISYSRRDNAQGRVTELKERIEADYRAFAGEELNCFFDRDDIHGMEDWRHRILDGLRQSSLLLLVLSPAYVASPYCEWEVIEYLKYEHSRAAQGQGVAPVYFVEIPGPRSPDFPAKEAAWLAQVRRRNRFDLRPWHEEGAAALKQLDVRTRLEDLERSLHDRLSKLRRLAEAPGNLPAHNPRFVGRELEMQRLHESAGLGRFGVLTALQGMGGLGKTALAIQYACAYADFYPGGRWLLGCAGRGSLAGVVRELDVDLNIQLTEDERRDDRRAAKRILAELETRARQGAAARAGEKAPPEPRALLLLDNVDDPSLLQPPESDLLSGKRWLHVLATTRLGPAEFGHDPERQSLLTVDELPPEDALRLIESYQPGGRFPNTAESTAAEEIVRRLGGFTLAVEVVGVYLGECAGRVTCAALLLRLQREGYDRVAHDTRSGVSCGYKLLEAALASTREILSYQEELVIAYAGILPPDKIPVEWIRKLLSARHPEFAQDAEPGYDDPWQSLLNHLVGLRILHIGEVHPGGYLPRYLRMHRLVQEALGEEDLRKRRALRRQVFDVAAGSPDAESLYRQTLSDALESKPIDAVAIAAARTDLGRLLIAKDAFQEAEGLLQEALSANEEVLGAGHPNTLTTIDDLALLRASKGDYATAETLSRRALEGYERVLGPVHPNTLKCLNNLATLLQAKGDLSGAEPLVRRALDGCERALGPVHPDTSKSLNNLAALLQAKGDLAGAEPLYRRALEGFEQALGPLHPDTLASVQDLADLLQAKGDIAGAEPLYRRVQERRERAATPRATTPQPGQGQPPISVSAQSAKRRSPMPTPLTVAGAALPPTAGFLTSLRRWLSAAAKRKQVENPEATMLPPGQRSTLRPGASPSAMLTSVGLAPTIPERVVRVYISSTFRDMVEDRNELMTHAWPALRRVCRERAVDFVEVDMRWGITEEQSRRTETIQYCLAEIRRCRPYFIGLLGERYGWVPEAEAFPEPLLECEGWLKPEIGQRSVQELEILHGVLNNPELAGHAFFYFRDAGYAYRRFAEGQVDLLEHCDHKEIEAFGEVEAARRAEERRARLAALKDRIRAVCREKAIPLREGDRYGNPQQLASLVLADLTAVIDAEFPADQLDVWAHEDRDHEAYAKSRCAAFYVGRDAYFDRLDTYARDGADGCGLTVLGDSGGGKSTLLANWVGRWRWSHPGDFVWQHYIGSSSLSAGHLGLMRRLMVDIVRWCGEASGGFGFEEERIPAQSDEIVKVFPEYLGRLAYQAKQKGVRALIVLDALNQLEDHGRGRLLAWLPYRYPLDLRLIVSTLPGDTLEALAPRAWPTLTVEPLTAEERIQLIARYLKHFSKGLSEQRAQTIAAVPASANPLYLKTLLDDLRVTGSQRYLDRQIADYLQAPDIPALLVKILARFERDYERDRPGLVREALSLIWAARRGLTEADLLRLLRPENLLQLPLAVWTPLRLAIEDGLVDRDGILGFRHDFLRAAVATVYMLDAEKVKTLRLRLAEDFEAQPITARSCDELPWLLRQVEARDRLRACLLDIERFLLIQERDQNELLADWVWLGEDETMGQAYLDSFARLARESGTDSSQSHFAFVANQLGLFLKYAGRYVPAEPLLRRGLEGRKRALGPAHADTLGSINNLGAVLQAKGDLAGAEPLFRRALEGRERALGPVHPDTLGSINNLGALLQAKGDLAEAEHLLRRALEGRERVIGAEHPETLTSLNSLAVLLQAKGDMARAEPLLWRALEGRERVLGTEHPDTLTSLNNLAALLRAKGELASIQSLVDFLDKTGRQNEAEPLRQGPWTRSSIT